MKWRCWKKEWRKQFWDAHSGMVFILTIVLFLGYSIDQQHSTANSSAAAAKSSAAAAATGQTNKALINKQTLVGRARHQATLKTDDELKSALSEIKYEAGVVTFLVAELSNTIADHSTTLAALTAVENQVAAVISQLPAADANIIQFVQGLDTVLGWVVGCISNHEMNCGSPPPVPSP